IAPQGQETCRGARAEWVLLILPYCGVLQFAPRPDAVATGRGSRASGALEAAGRPVFQLHAQGQAACGQNFLDLVERLAAQVRRLQQLVLGALDEIADVV